jgi:Tfp pilus assembly protein PilN
MKIKLTEKRRKKLTTILGLALDGSRLEGVVLKRTNGSLQKLQSFSATLALDPLTAAPELVGREIRNHLDAAGVRERNCVLGLPLKWLLTAQTELPAALSDADAASLLQLELEKGFHADAETLQTAGSRCALADGRQFVLLAGVPNAHLGLLGTVLAAAKLKPVSFALGISALQPERRSPTRREDRNDTQLAGAETGAPGALALVIGENSVGLQVTAGGGVAALRSLDGAVENLAGQLTLHEDVVAREARITLGQLPAELRGAVKHIRVFGPRGLAQNLADAMELKFGPAGLSVDVVSAHAPDEFGVALPAEAPVSAAFSLAARLLTEQSPAFEFLPPKPTLLEQLVAKYSSGRLRTAGAVGALVGLLVGGIFGGQQVQLWYLRSQWSGIEAKAAELQAIQSNIHQYRPWYDGSFKNLSILRQLTRAFPEDGSVTAKNIAVRGGAVTCSGTARDYAALLAMQARLRVAAGVSNVKLEQVRGKAPMQFVFGFTYNNNGGAE